MDGLRGLREVEQIARVLVLGKSRVRLAQLLPFGTHAMIDEQLVSGKQDNRISGTGVVAGAP